MIVITINNWYIFPVDFFNIKWEKSVVNMYIKNVCLRKCILILYTSSAIRSTFVHLLTFFSSHLEGKAKIIISYIQQSNSLVIFANF